MTIEVARPLRSEPAEALARACEHLIDLQRPDGWWKGELETNVTMDAEDLLLREFLGIRTDEETQAAARFIRSRQRPDGTWANFHGGPADLSTTIEAYAALRLAGDAPEARHMQQAASFVRDAGGIERSRVFTRIWLALFGLWPWQALPAMPPEQILLPAWVPLNVYDFACWARQTVVALTVVAAHRPRRPLPFRLDELHSGAPPPPLPPRGWPRRLARVDRALHVYDRAPIAPLRRMALARAERWIVERQEADGSWGGIQPPWVYSLMALHLQGYAVDHPVMQRGLRGLDGFTIREGDERRMEACQSPVWDTALAMIALCDGGYGPGDEPLVRATGWILGEEVRCRGDWAVRRPALEPSGWAFEFANDCYPDIDDTAEVLIALRRAGGARGDVDDAISRGLRWAVGMQSRDGGWAAFDADNVQALCRELPFCDFGEVIDPPSADVTAHMLELLGLEGLTAEEPARRGLRWLLERQEDDGSWFGRWGANHVYGTGAALQALQSLGISPAHPAVRRGADWLVRMQSDGGGWGEDMRSYVDPSWRGRGHATASQTAWALLGLLAAGDARSDAVARGVAWLVDTQLEGGGWDEPWYTGTGFPGYFYINYHLYRIVFPIMALGRYVRALR